MEYTDEQLDITMQKIVDIEKNLCIMQDNITTLSEQIRETQRYLIKMAHNQTELAKRVATWPYISVPKAGGK